MSNLRLKFLAILVHAIVGWAYCGAIMWVGRALVSIDAALVLHAIGAPIGFGLLSWLYHKRFGFTRPVMTAALFLGGVVTLDVFLVAMVVEKSFDMFRSVLGTWLPFALIFAATWGVGAFVTRGAASTLAPNDERSPR